MANKCIDQIAYHLPSYVEIHYNPHSWIARWQLLDQGMVSLISVTTAKTLLKTVKPRRVEVKLKAAFDGSIYVYKQGQLLSVR